jgi:peptide/nickel transport system substrate-binding protein
MKRRNTRLKAGSVVVLLVAVAVALVVALGGGGSSNQEQAASGTEGKSTGGTYRVGLGSSFGWTNALDPTGEYLSNAWSIYSSLMIRTLVGYNHIAGVEGTVVVPDTATEVPSPTNDGKTYTFHIKEGIEFGPPVNRPVTSEDFKFAMERLAKPENGGQYASYYAIIEGWDAFADGKAETISGIETPDPSTITFTLTEPAGDFPNRMTLPATGPLPEEVAGCFKGSKANTYGRVVVSTAGYMIEGMDDVDISSCDTIKPARGFNPLSKLALVRNPAYAPETDSTEARENLPDRFEFTTHSNVSDIFDKIANGELDENADVSPPATVIQRYATDPELKPLLKQNASDRIKFLMMNLTKPPFDDIRVRKAFSLVTNKQALRQAWGGPTAGEIATHIVPNNMLGPLLEDFDPYETPSHEGSVELAKAALKGSKYDTRGRGMCDAPECKNVLLVADTLATDEAMLPLVTADAAKIGITFNARTVSGAYSVINVPKNGVVTSTRTGWGKDYADAYTYVKQFESASIIPSGNVNYSLVGITPEIAKRVDATGTIQGVPSVDADIAKCLRMTGDPRTECWAEVDRKLMTDVIPWVPYLDLNVINILSRNVTKWQFDTFSGRPSYGHVSVK